MFKVWRVDAPQTTLDIDLLGSPDVIEHVDAIVRATCCQQVEPDDGLVFDPDSVRTGAIAEQANFEGVRAVFQGNLLNARIPMQIDVGPGTISPLHVVVDVPAILDFPPPRLKGYTRESAIAEKFHAMVKLEILNSRMKDFFDVWLLCRRFQFEGTALGRAVAETFTQRETEVPLEPMALSMTFAENSAKVVQWQAFLRKQQLGLHAPGSLREVIDGIASFLGPVSKALASGGSLKATWPPGGPWQVGVERHDRAPA